MRTPIFLLLAACGTGSTQLVGDGVDARPGETPDAREGGETPDARPVTGELSDEFDGNSLSSAWQVFKGNLADISVSGGQLHMTPTEYCVWYQADSGPGLFKRVSGDFKVTSSVKVRSASDPGAPPPPEYQFGGLIARDPADRRENWVFAVIGERSGYLALESKTTVNGESTINAPDWGSGDAEIRICRVGARFLLLARHAGGAWEPQGDHNRPDLPATLQVGPIAYAYTNSPNIKATFDRVEIAPVSSASDCTAD